MGKNGNMELVFVDGRYRLRLDVNMLRDGNKFCAWPEGAPTFVAIGSSQEEALQRLSNKLGRAFDGILNVGAHPRAEETWQD